MMALLNVSLDAMASATQVVCRYCTHDCGTKFSIRYLLSLMTVCVPETQWLQRGGNTERGKLKETDRKGYYLL